MADSCPEYKMEENPAMIPLPPADEKETDKQSAPMIAKEIATEQEEIDYDDTKASSRGTLKKTWMKLMMCMMTIIPWTLIDPPSNEVLIQRMKPTAFLNQREGVCFRNK